jgi:hypothetical protein
MGRRKSLWTFPAPLPERRRFATIVPVVLADFVRFTTG